MAASSDIAFAQDGSPAKLHPYLVALIRWCVSCFWSTATIFLHRLMTAPPLPLPIAGVVSKIPNRPAGREHLHPEPKVECTVLHQPDTHELDVIFVHGLYGSLGNTWRQGEWHLKYRTNPELVHLRRTDDMPVPCECNKCTVNPEQDTQTTKNTINENHKIINVNNKKTDTYNNGINNNDDDYEDNAFTSIDEEFYSDITKILPKDDVFLTEKFYNNALLDQVEIIDNYESQAKFVSDLFKECDDDCDSSNYSDETEYIDNEYKNNKVDVNENSENHFLCKCKDLDKKCEVGCGCICDDCYSPCWPRDWIRIDYPNARIISINYTSDPHLWRPLWVKESKRLCLHQRAEQMTKQLLELGVGDKPVVWVGHSKGGLFIKQIYCEAYEAYLKAHPEEHQKTEQIKEEAKQITEDFKNNTSDLNTNSSIIHENMNNNNENVNNNNAIINNNDNEGTTDENESPTDFKEENNVMGCQNECRIISSNNKEDQSSLLKRAGLWQNTIAFMFYSVPHRGSPLAAIKTPITARSVELMEISKDNALVLALQARWLVAVEGAGAAGAGRRGPPLVRSLVETRRTLMSVVWLRIVSADSADPGVGALCGVPVDHREICKPSSRHCILYTELSTLIRLAIVGHQTSS